ncbi:hypothetical protein [Nitrolancea hollandica]|uniref:Uncharacterized protein n=1 Tax=Nitrolancea hollandica Lb TaxID=1129897 RepID=I4EKZ8_9BACT|nr:hypothetical protein [Nitrolancea hollandica]CCF85360.1 hypothetical protein NITHO_4880005 [Nitrolancea hollandica Lb]
MGRVITRDDVTIRTVDGGLHGFPAVHVTYNKEIWLRAIAVDEKDIEKAIDRCLRLLTEMHHRHTLLSGAALEKGAGDG